MSVEGKYSTNASEILGSQYDKIENIRSKLANAVLFAIAIFGAPVVVATLFRSLEVGGRLITLIQLGSYLVCLAIAIFHRRLSLNLRASVVIGSAFLVACTGTFKWGLIGMGVPFFIMCSVIVTVFYGTRPGILATGIGLAVLAVVGYCLNTELLQVGFDIQNFAVAKSSWITAIVVYGFFTAIIVTCLGRLYSSMTGTIEKLTSRTLELKKVNENLENEIAGRREVEKALRESEEKSRILYEKSRKEEEVYRSLLYTSADAIVLYDLEGKVAYVNPSFTQIFGWTLEELEGERIPFVPDSEKKRVMIGIKQILEEGIPIQGFETKRYTREGPIKDVNISGSRYDDHEGKPAGMLVLLRDITEKKRLEAQLQQTHKMEAMGLLAGGVAHDLNNILSGIVSYPEILLLDLPEESKLRKPIETIRESGHRAAAIVQDLLTVARGVATTKEPLNINDLISDYLHSPEFRKLKQFHPRATVKTNLDRDLFNISGSYVHIRKVVMNLVSNASEAIEGNGNVIISTMNHYVGRPIRGYEDVNTGEYVILSVSDDGSGIPSDDLERIFEPFYTKKVMGRSGTGLGLAVVWNVTQDHKGYIDVTSDKNGTSFELCFPITRDEILDTVLSIPIRDYKGNGETILVVDDVESQREISCKMLDTLGYKTKAVSSGEEAVEYLKEHSVDLILLDMIMAPGINGRETYERVIKIHPNQKAIIISGFAETDDVKEAQKFGAGKYLKKPVTLEKIGMAVKEELMK